MHASYMYMYIFYNCSFPDQFTVNISEITDKYAKINCNDGRYDAPPHRCFIQCNNNSVKGVSSGVEAKSVVYLLNLQPEQNYTCVALAANSTSTSSISAMFNFTTTGLYLF